MFTLDKQKINLAMRKSQRSTSSRRSVADKYALTIENVRIKTFTASHCGKTRRKSINNIFDKYFSFNFTQKNLMLISYNSFLKMTHYR